MTPEEGAEFLGARMVGRWKSGTPIDLAPLQDNPDIAKDPDQVNNFDYTFNDAGGNDQVDQNRCPFAAHLRKTNPRADLSPEDKIVAPHRIIRQGIPYGPEVTNSEAQSGKTTEHRGLAFVSYQSSLAQGFVFLQQSWANNITFPPGKNVPIGFDPVIGQNKVGSTEAFTTSGLDPKNQQGTPLQLIKFVNPRGGEYFFSPSISALKTVIAN